MPTSLTPTITVVRGRTLWPEWQCNMHAHIGRPIVNDENPTPSQASAKSLTASAAKNPAGLVSQNSALHVVSLLDYVGAGFTPASD